MQMKKSNLAIALIAAAVVGAAATAGIGALYKATSDNDTCMSCHYHSEADAAWKQSVHYSNPSGTKTDCAACHLPPEGGVKHFAAKTKVGIKDIWSYLTKDKEDIDWEVKGDLDYARRIVYNESCEECHVNLLPEGISDDGITAHLYYEEHRGEYDMQCINCHLDAGHYNPGYSHSRMAGVPKIAASDDTPVHAAAVVPDSFEDFTETVPGTRVSIPMKAIPGGSFLMGSPVDEYGRLDDEGPQRTVSVSPFFMAETEVTWDLYWTFYSETMSEGRTPPETVYALNSRPDLDAVTGPTPPFGAPDQGWGMGSRPAITMTWYAAVTFCRWLSLKTGKTWRLPTEAEWEYAARGGTSSPYFVDAAVKKSAKDPSVLGKAVIYGLNSRNRSAEPSSVEANPFGLRNMLGNVAEYCSDWYAPDAYEMLADGASDPKGPASGREHVVRGGLYNSSAAQVRCAARSCTHHDDWLRTDPQNPKSIWWYSDCKGIGFRVVCEVPDNLKQ